MTQAAQLSSGDRVRITEAPAETPDAKGLVYYDFMRNLTGSVIKAYDDGTVSISIDRESLPEAVLQRHENSERMQGERWLNSLSDDDRSKLSDKERDFKLRYTVLVATKHVVPESEVRHAPRTAEPEVHRKTSAEIEAEEAAHLKAIEEANANKSA